ncbi:hypothetical protein [Lapidilactobacillus luobeiensis]|uniref:hypothetical protein n=1 Tax=Lapidilactobacillus luobeiensis TaxID=2950371 RepID=UPI0021C40A09|nr:hypothetical protein [Lapidilactobacillus luobeiensis]
MENNDKDKLSYLTDDQKVYLRLVRKSMPLHQDDMVKTLVYLQRHPNVIKPFESSAANRLTAAEKNQVLCELLLQF